MLTKSDLSAIKVIVQDEIKPVRKDVSGLKKDISILKTDVSGLKKDMKVVRKDLKTTINFFDGEYLGVKKRVEKIEVKVGIPTANF